MMRTALAMILTAVVGVGVFARDDEAEKPKGDNPDDAPRLKRKKRPDAPPPVQEEKDKAEKDKEKAEKDREKVEKDKGARDKKDKEKKAKDKEDDFVPEDGPPGEEREDEQDVLKRVRDNMQGVEDKLGNKEIGDPTQQQQRDIIKDLDDLINRSQQQENGGGGGGANQQQNQDQDQDQQNQKGGQQQKQKAGQKQGKQGQQQQQRAQRQPRQQQQRQQQQMAKNDRKEQDKKKEDGGGQDGGMGKKGDGETGGPKNDDKPLREVWGHLPESLRAEMNAYSNPKPFMPRYDDLIKKYYRTIAEQGRKKGD